MPALVRAFPDSYPGFYAGRGVTIDLTLARRQHAAYVAALEEAGLAVRRVPADERFPDCVFIEDTAVVFNNIVVVTRMAAHREGEQAGVLPFLETTHRVVRLPPGATLDGGDVLHAGEVTCVGRSRRSNAAGAAALREALAPRPVIEIPVEHCLHLKSAATWLGDGTMLAAGDWVDVARFPTDRVLLTAPGENKAANTLRVGSRLLALSRYGATFDRLRTFCDQHAVSLVGLDESEAEKGDGSLTCLSIVFTPASDPSS